jgi:hypothetical protein
MRQKRMGISAVKTSFGGVGSIRRKRTLGADSPDSGLVYPHTVGLTSHIRNGNFVEVCAVPGPRIPGSRGSLCVEAIRRVIRAPASSRCQASS